MRLIDAILFYVLVVSCGAILLLLSSAGDDRPSSAQTRAEYWNMMSHIILWPLVVPFYTFVFLLSAAANVYMTFRKSIDKMKANIEKDGR